MVLVCLIIAAVLLLIAALFGFTAPAADGTWRGRGFHIGWLGLFFWVLAEILPAIK